MDIANLRGGCTFHFTDEHDEYRVLNNDKNRSLMVARDIKKNKVVELIYDMFETEDREVVVD